jgi:hypothetical protein
MPVFIFARGVPFSGVFIFARGVPFSGVFIFAGGVPFSDVFIFARGVPLPEPKAASSFESTPRHPHTPTQIANYPCRGLACAMGHVAPCSVLYVYRNKISEQRTNHAE